MDEKQTRVKELKRLILPDPNNKGKMYIPSKEFTANGKTYFIEDQISFDRWVMHEKYQAELGCGIELRQIMMKLREIYDSANESRFADVVVISYNLMKGISDTDDSTRIPLAVKMCSLFINEKDEDRRFFNPAVMTEKINDWKEEGINMPDFFTLAISFIPDFMPLYEAISRDIFLAIPKEKRPI